MTGTILQYGSLKKTPNPICLPAPLLFSVLMFFRELDWQQTKPIKKINRFYVFNSQNKFTEGQISNMDDDEEEE